MFKVTLRCQITGKHFDTWVKDREDAPECAERLKGTVVSVEPSTQTEFDLAQVLTMLGARKQLRDP